MAPGKRRPWRNRRPPPDRHPRLRRLHGHESEHARCCRRPSRPPPRVPAPPQEAPAPAAPLTHPFRTPAPTRLGPDYVLTDPANDIPFGYGPDAWGNAKGFDLFNDLYACYPDDGPPPEDGRTNLDLVLDYWLDVAERIRHLAGDHTTP